MEARHCDRPQPGPDSSVVNLIGDGTIYGNIAVRAGDRIDVKAGITYFDGMIGPAFNAGGRITYATLDSGLSGYGTLTIADGGNLILTDPRLTGITAMYDGPSYVALVDTLNVASDGALTLDLSLLRAACSGGELHPGLCRQALSAARWSPT